MHIKMPVKEREDIFVLNPTLLRIPEFTALRAKPHNMDFVALVADTQSIFARQPEEKRRELACKATISLNSHGKLTAEGKKLCEKRDKDVEKAIEYYKNNINPPIHRRLSIMLEAWSNQWDNIANVLKYGDGKYQLNENGEIMKDKNGNPIKASPEDTIKIQEQCNKIAEKGLDRKIWASIEFYEEKLSHVYKPSETVLASIPDDNKEDLEFTNIGDIMTEMDADN